MAGLDVVASAGGGHDRDAARSADQLSVLIGDTVFVERLDGDGLAALAQPQLLGPLVTVVVTAKNQIHPLGHQQIQQVFA